MTICIVEEDSYVRRMGQRAKKEERKKTEDWKVGWVKQMGGPLIMKAYVSV